MYLLKATLPTAHDPLYFFDYTGWTHVRDFALRFKAEELLPFYQELVADFRTSVYTIDIERVEE